MSNAAPEGAVPSPGIGAGGGGSSYSQRAPPPPPPENDGGGRRARARRANRPSPSATAAPSPGPPQVELVLSRPSYRVGGTVVGTVRLVPPTVGGATPAGSAGSEAAAAADDDAATRPTQTPPHPREAFSSAKLYLAAHCRIDPRWHDARSLADLYGTHPHLSGHLPPEVETIAVHSYFGERRDGVHVEGGTTVCFWATNVVELMELRERPDRGSWDEMRPRPLSLGCYDGLRDDDDGRGVAVGGGGNDLVLDGDDDAADDSDYEDNEDDDDGRNDRRAGTRREAPKVRLEERQLAFTFRSTLPADGPPSAKAASARYFYSAVICAETTDGELHIVQAPFTVQTRRTTSETSSLLPRPTVVQSAGRVKIGTLTAVAHSNGLPCYVSPTDMIRPAKLSVDRGIGLCSRPTASDVRSMRVTDQGGAPCCALTLVGTSVMYPGGRAMVRFDFDEEVVLRPAGGLGGGGASGGGGLGFDQDGDDAGATGGGETTTPRLLLPCHRVAISLQGDEVARHDDGTMTRTRTYAFDAAQAAIEPGCTDSVSLSVALPLDCPCTLRTDLVEIAITCKVELTVEKKGGGGGSGGFDVLRLEVPCEVVQDASEDDLDMEGEEDEEAMVRGPLQGKDARDENGWSGGFVADDIMNDLKMLSLHMIHSCALDVS